VELDGGHVVPAVDSSEEKEFFSGLANRICGLRCEIVHSNPDFEDGHHPIPVTARSMEIINEENRIMRMRAVEMIANATMFSL
jgi:hypothetical protein